MAAAISECKSVLGCLKPWYSPPSCKHWRWNNILQRGDKTNAHDSLTSSIKQSWFWSLTFSAEKRLTDRVPSRTLPTKLKFSALSTSLQPVTLSLHWTFAIHSLNGTHMTNQSTPLSSLLRLLPEVLISPNPAGPIDIIPKVIWHHSEFWSVKSSFHFMTLTTPYVQASRDYDSRDFWNVFEKQGESKSSHRSWAEANLLHQSHHFLSLRDGNILCLADKSW